MLDKILNITPGSDFNNSSPQKGHREFTFHRNTASQDVHDSISFSPAWLFISQLNWHIISIKMPKEERLLLTFLVSDIEFNIELDLLDLSNKSPFIYNISQNKNFNNTEKVTSITLEKKLTFKGKNNPPHDYKGLLKLFERVWNLNLNYELSDEECYLNNLLDEIYDEINYEMEFITISLIAFTEKLMGITFSFLTAPREKRLKEENDKMEIKVKKVKSTGKPMSTINA